MTWYFIQQRSAELLYVRLFTRIFWYTHQTYILFPFKIIEICSETLDYKFTRPLRKKLRQYEGQDVTLLCTVNDYEAEVRWFKGDEQIFEADRNVITWDVEGNKTLTIKKISSLDPAVYKCRIKNTKHVTKCALHMLRVSGITKQKTFFFYLKKRFIFNTFLTINKEMHKILVYGFRYKVYLRNQDIHKLTLL